IPHENVIEALRDSALFVLPCVTASDGDRDGIPNVILEAMAMQLPVVSTEHSGIPEVVTNGVNGLLVPAGQAPPLAQGLAKLLDEADLRQQMGVGGRQMVQENFDAMTNAERLLQKTREP